MDTININEVLPAGKHIKKFLTGSEIMLAVAINAYTKHLLGKQLDCRDIRVNPELLGQNIFHFACDSPLQPDGVLFNEADKPTGTPSGQLVQKFKPFMLNIVESFVMEITPESWRFSYSMSPFENSQIRTGDVKFNYCYIIAKYLLWCYMNPKSPTPKLIIDQDGYSIYNDEYAALIILQQYGNKIMTPSIMELRYKNGVNEDFEWVAYWEEKRERGFAKSANFTYTTQDKVARMKALQLRVGDVVLLYKRKASKNNGDITQNVTACYPAVIYGIDEAGITLTYYTQTDLKLTRKYHIELMQMNGGGSIYTRNDIVKFDSSHKKFDWFTIGIEGCSTNESVLIIPPVADDTTRQYINNGYKDCEVELNSLETIYALFEDRNIKYNKERFLARYFKGQIPIYEQYRIERERVKNQNKQ